MKETNMIKLSLIAPISFGLEIISELNFQDLKAKHMRNLPKDVGINDILNLASALPLSGIPSKFIDELSSNDTIRVVELINGFS